jgi:TonB family protein
VSETLFPLTVYAKMPTKGNSRFKLLNPLCAVGILVIFSFSIRDLSVKARASGEPIQQPPQPKRAKSSQLMPMMHPSVPRRLGAEDARLLNDQNVYSARIDSYMESMQTKIQENGRPMLAFKKYTKVTVTFKLHSHGEVSNLQVTGSSGLHRYDEIALKIIQSCSPFPEPPVVWIKENSPAEIEFTFDGKFKASLETFLRNRIESKRIERKSRAIQTP